VEAGMVNPQISGLCCSVNTRCECPLYVQ
jgi:hypothetical protein